MTGSMRWRLVWPVGGVGSQRGSGVRLARLGYRGRVVGCLGFVLVVACLVFGVAPALAVSGAPGWGIDSFATPTNFSPGGSAEYTVTATNVGSLPTDGSGITLSDVLPAGLTAQSVSFFWSGLPEVPFGGPQKDLAPVGLCTTVPVQCTFPGPLAPILESFKVASLLAPDGTLKMVVHVSVDPGASGVLLNGATVSGGGAL